MHLNYILLWVLLWKVAFHPFYLSLTEIRYNPSSGSLEFSQRIFWDDLEVALSDIHKESVDFLNPADQKRLDEMVEDYLLAHNKIQVNGEEVDLNFLGYEVEDEAAWFYMEVRDVDQPSKISLTCWVLLAHFETQQNIVNIFVTRKPKSLILHKGKESGEIYF